MKDGKTVFEYSTTVICRGDPSGSLIIELISTVLVSSTLRVTAVSKDGLNEGESFNNIILKLFVVEASAPTRVTSTVYGLPAM